MRRFIVVAAAALSSIAIVGFLTGRRWFSTWGIVPIEGLLTLPGDDLVPEPTMSDTRGLTIDAPPSAVWPWLVQLGFGRGGWYSYDAMDMKGRSADAILPEHQSLAVGDIVPTDPNGGFEVRVLEPEHALVLLVDNEIVARRTDMPRIDAAATPGLAASGRFMQASMPPEFAVSWAIILQPVEGGRTRLVERVRARYGTETRGSRAFGPALGFGVFLMTRKQMLGLAERARRMSTRTAALPPDGVPAATETATDTGATDTGAPVASRAARASRGPRHAKAAPDEPAADPTTVAATPIAPTQEGPAPANGHAPDLADTAPAP